MSGNTRTYRRYAQRLSAPVREVGFTANCSWGLCNSNTRNRINWLQIVNLYDFQNQKQILRSASGGLKHAAVHITSSMSARSSRGLVCVITQINVSYFSSKKN